MSLIKDYSEDFIKRWNIKRKKIMNEIIIQYHEIYCQESDNGKLYGRSGEDLLYDIAPLVLELNPDSILDYGCGRSALINYFWNDGKRKLYKYDPAIRYYSTLTIDKCDMVLCTDVLEHLPELYLASVINIIKSLTDNVVFTISLIKARKKLPNGMNAHITVRPAAFWLELIGLCYNTIDVIKQDEKWIFIKTWI